MKSLFWGGYCLLFLLATSLGYSLGHDPKLAGDGCAAETGCMACVIYSCPVLEEGQTKVAVAVDQVLCCVEYDHIEPSHCATVNRTSYEIREGMFTVAYCYGIVCCYGTPTSEECMYAYEC